MGHREEPTEAIASRKPTDEEQFYIEYAYKEPVDSITRIEEVAKFLVGATATASGLLAAAVKIALGSKPLTGGLGVWTDPYYRIVNAAFCNAHPEGSRFNGPDRGAWYAAFERETALAAVIFHKTLALAEIDVFDDDVTYEDYLADFRGDFHDIRSQDTFAECLAPDSYIASQTLAERLLQSGSAGIVYPSVRSAEGINLVCFQPALVAHVRQGDACRLVWPGNPEPEVFWAP